MLTEPDFYDKAKAFALLKDVDGKYFTYDEYRDLIKATQTDKDGNLVYLYASHLDEQYSYIEAARAKGYSVLLMDGELDIALVGMLEQKFEKSRFARVDGDTIDRLILKEDAKDSGLAAEDSSNLSALFTTQMPKLDKVEFHVEVAPLGETAAPVLITQSEYMRRMKEMSRLQSGMSFYGEMPSMMSVVLNADHRLVKRVLDDMKGHTADALAPIEAELKGLHARHAALEQAQQKKKADEITQEDRDNLSQCNKDIAAEEEKKTKVLSDYGAGQAVVHQLIDIALLQNGLLKGKALDQFLKRSVELI